MAKGRFLLLANHETRLQVGHAMVALRGQGSNGETLPDGYLRPDQLSPRLTEIAVATRPGDSPPMDEGYPSPGRTLTTR